LKKLAIITTHPIQYYAPIFQVLHERGNIELKVFYTWGKDACKKHDPGFGKSIEWDLPLLDGYPFEWIQNTASDPGSHHYKGIKNPSLIKQVSIWQPDAVLVFGWAYQSHLTAMRYFHTKLPVYFRGDSTLLDDKKNLRSVLKSIFLKWVYGFTDHAFYVGTQNKKYFKKYGLKESQLTFAPHAADNLRFEKNRSAEAAEIRDQLGVGVNDLLVLYAGKFEEKKNPGILLQAFIELNNPDVRLLFVGNGILEINLKSQISNLKSDNIHFIDFQNQTQMPVIYQACDLFCLPSKGPAETWGLAVNEAMACGKAILVSDQVGCAADLIKPGENGFIFKSGNLADLKEKLEHLTECKTTLKAYGKRSQEIISEWNFSAIASALENQLNNEPER